MGGVTWMGLATALFAMLASGLFGLWWGYDKGVVHTEKRWNDSVTRAGVRVVHRCGICGFNRGEGIG